MGSAVAQEACMNRDKFQATWKQFKRKIVFERFRAPENTRKGLDLNSANMSRGGESAAQPPVFRPDDRAKRSEFSLHIGS
jgi:hypothetical protein